MKQHFLYSIITIMLISCNHKKGAIVSYNAKIINLGSLQFKKSYSDKILIKNIGDETLKIGEISPDCSCTVPKLDNNNISPGDSTFISFVLTPGEDGFIQQSLYVDNNSINENRILFLIRANVKIK